MNNLTNPLAEWLDAIPAGEYAGIRLRIINECKVTRATLCNWRNGTSKVPPLAQEKINLIAEKEIFKLETK